MIKKITVGFLLALLVLPSCGHKKSNLLPLQMRREVRKEITVAVSPLDKYACQDQFGYKIKKYQALQLTINNNSDHFYLLNTYQIGLPLITPKQVAQSVFDGCLPAALIGLGIGLAAASAASDDCSCCCECRRHHHHHHHCSDCHCHHHTYVAVDASAGEDHSYRKLEKRITKQSIDPKGDALSIAPFGSLSRTLFVSPEAAQRPFVLTLLDTKTNKGSTFKIDLVGEKERLQAEQERAEEAKQKALKKRRR